ncbi:hypothetical protein G5C60_08540 [Streptomyces sp. HC44]|uniref:Uncharacterized protein n=1 Tax=Streptomyces scabichelini TaxID=2711217 RepID=A0A6G4V1C7_9ACTN|nr:hypothetical protein [Streptomyces scabichelini]NGO07700.1 hypothetical protein [Streptomyces scabichelini]
MFEYERQQFRSAEMIREADNYRQARAAVRARRAARRSAKDDAEGQVNRQGPRRHRFARAA